MKSYDSLEMLDARLCEFFEGMVYKLHKNAHKKTPETHDIPAMTRLLLGEMGEFMEQFYKDKTDANTVVELFDIANFAFLIFLALRNQGVADWNMATDEIHHEPA